MGFLVRYENLQMAHENSMACSFHVLEVAVDVIFCPWFTYAIANERRFGKIGEHWIISMMNDQTKPTPDVLRQAILQLNEPVIFKGILDNEEPENNWRLFELTNLTRLIDENRLQKLPFRVGVNAQTLEPQWDIACPVITMNLGEFVNKVQHDEADKWYYFDYKYMNDWFEDKPDVLNAVNWKNFGFDKSGKDSTLWIGSKGAHTNCHQDTYGCNLIAQLHGSKQWLLFPPESSKMLKETRVPYEESTIYSKINFFCPSKEDVDYIWQSEACRRLPKLTTLHSGDVLLVPAGWWHYVESLDVTVSVNIWLSLDRDYKARVKEAVVKLIMSGLGEGLPTADGASSSVQTCLTLIEECKKQYCESQDRTAEQDNKRPRKTQWTTQNLVTEYPQYVMKLPDLDKDSLREFLTSQRERFSKAARHLKDAQTGSDNAAPSYRNLKLLIDNLCHSDNIDKLTDVLLSD